MAWFQASIRSSLLAIFGNANEDSTPPASAEEAAQRLQQIRGTMSALARTGSGRAASGLALRLDCARDVQALWFMRSELMVLLAHSHGEAHARATLARLNQMFDGALPEGLRSRPSPLGEA